MRMESLWMAALAVTAVLAAGCATPEETAEPRERHVQIDGRVYECDDTLDADGVCDEYVYADDQDAQTEASYQSASQGTVTIDGRTYRCDDRSNVDVVPGGDEPAVGVCEEYLAQEE